MEDDIRNALKILKEGGVILYPTDTIWGLGCDPVNSAAINRIYNLKERDDKKSMLLLVDDPSMLPSYVTEIPDIAFELMEAATSPLTIIYPGAKNLAGNLVAEDGSVGIRVTSDPFCKKLIQEFGRPIVSTSANRSGELSPGTFHDISPAIIQQADYVVSWRQEDTQTSVPSSILKLDTHGRIKIVRK